MVNIMSKKFNLVKKYYEQGLWNKKRVHDAVTKEWITAAEYKEITGEEYEVQHELPSFH